ncbi:hypothetical protein [Flavobacterium piscis]|uniref:Uncharacterized protein n=1 Tax=Flavobacterium piscis TaxID=1114874 RepID=A0ABU1Y9Z2_9FLAO|nr:hypothetical protein [Flavobacterium piscis]MDR7211052.1 hypothetical protein [Flavobacterium piscis]
MIITKISIRKIVIFIPKKDSECTDSEGFHPQPSQNENIPDEENKTEVWKIAFIVILTKLIPIMI